MTDWKNRPSASLRMRKGCDKSHPYFTNLMNFMNLTNYEHPLVSPQVVHFRHVPLRTIVKLPHDEHTSPVYPFSLASFINSILPDCVCDTVCG